MRAGEILDDRYALEQVLGQGGMGVVWAARDRTTGSRVAIKLLLDDDTSEDNPAHESFRKELRQRLQREAEACMKLGHHPNVVRVHDFSKKDTDQHGPYIVMELLEGESLQAHLKRKRTLEPKVAARIIADVASCLTAAHTAKLVHRDLKPANIYLHRDPGMDEDEFVTKVLDFGVCKDGDSVENAADRTKTNMVLGSIAYMSPQQAMGSKNVDFSTDIWSVGVVLYELLTGLRAFSGGVDDIVKMYTPILIGKSTMPVPAPSSRMRNIPPALDIVVERCTKPKPADRYASAEELARDLYTIAGLPMPVIPSAKASRSGRSPVGARELIDLYEPAILGSKAVPDAQEERRFNHLASTVPLGRAADETVVAPPPGIEEKVVFDAKPAAATDVLMFAGQNNAPDPSDAAATLFMMPKAPSKPMSQSSSRNAPSADAAARTQYLAPDAPIASPLLDLNEMHQALAEHRKSSILIPIPDLSDLEVSGGTQLLMKPAEVPPAKQSEPGVTTTGLIAQSLPHVRRGSLPSDAAGTTGQRRRKNRVFLMMIGGVVVAAMGALVVVVLKQTSPTGTAAGATPQSITLPYAPVSSDVTVEPPPTAPPQQDEAKAMPTTSATVDPAPASSATSSPTTVPVAPEPIKSTSVPPKRWGPMPPKPPLKCTGVGVFKRCK